MEPARLRVSDEERHQVAEVLRLAAGEGRIDLDELDERLEAAFNAKTYADLVPITADLPTAGGSVVRRPTGHVVAGPAYSSSFAMMSETRRSGAWQVGPHHSAFALMGQVVIDLRTAVFTSREVVINASALMGGVDVIVNPQTAVICDGTGFMGEYNESRSGPAADIRDDSPVVRVKGLALMGAVKVKRRSLPGESKSLRSRR